MITPHDQYLSLGRSPESIIKAYKDLFTAHLDGDEIKEIRCATNGNYVLGEQRFQEQIESMLKRRVCPGKPGRPKKEQ